MGTGLDPLREAARRDRWGPAVDGPTTGDGTTIRWSWSELDQVVDAAALRLGEAGVGPGHAVATLLPPSPEFVALLHAVPRAGAVLLPYHPGWTEAELGRALAAVPAPRLLLVPDREVTRVRRLLPEVGTVRVEDIVPVGVGPAGPDAEPVLRPAVPDPDSDTPIVLLLTSGSTGTPRPVPLTHGNLLASATAAARRLGLDPMDRWLASLSPSHVGGLALLHRGAVVGSSVVLRPRFDPEEFLDLARRGEITHASLVPVMLRRVLEYHGGRAHPAPRGLRCVLVGGASMPPALLEEALGRRWPVALTYGLTEASSQVATAPPGKVREKPGSVGRPLPGVEVKVTGPDESGVGEILVRGPTVAPLPPWVEGPRPAAVCVDGHGWLHTGDLGRIDDEGDLWVVGRSSDRIVTGGVTVEPGEVVAVLLEHPQVREAAVLGLPDPEWGERIAAAVVPLDPDAPPSLAELSGFCRDRLASARRPRVFCVLQALPRNTHGKVDRQALRSHLEGAVG
jgi:o-succinylbenzoate---CoA ligase